MISFLEAMQFALIDLSKVTKFKAR
jgi:hypothetical protein